ncbi:MAG: hypothetical protein CO135_00850 [Candidatus Levybacteria bacterium CG_4_9_14_3_um_filter_35_16]|nr:MAG: hypothetical protein COW87_00560 [Candidatus Levybacteria bacterium CG22_combo_CG10-13_8_21_14_all_35_11]PIZ98594.1 MAG: hypothetical protein COX78_02975 [Candidatus Levybacteria bacterium CG_4_10_14_0_2_um_filter_35_8]PJA91506.1 MAG: hypothetical protein CO135_00850 [Candidatus Levybacteria bacterium CG_4_9_14_3_um_filter_35_16]PJC54131.1 MAG: hypothetical protein CO028_03990 [Candidatus Levybacteria bacterium CG_4_9_14_0_2_um_filter_35_21]
MKLISYCNRIIEYSFYLIFFLVPLVLASETSELFEFNKLWITYGFTVVIAASWFTKMITRRQIKIQKTPLDIPILIFLLSQVISTIISLDPHVSLWGYYTRFNGGLLSIISYVLLYYAFMSNLASIAIVKRIIKISLASAAITALWGFPSHFGYDPTCLMFRGSFDVSCWTADFMPKVRIFSTLGQPDWFAAYLSIIIPLSIVMFINSFKQKLAPVKNLFFYFSLKSALFLGLTILFYLDLTYTLSRSSALALWVSLIIFALIFLILQRSELKFAPKQLLGKYWHSGLVALTIFLIIFFVGQPFPQLSKFTYAGIISKVSSLREASQKAKTPPVAQKAQPQEQVHYGELGGTDSVKIRYIVWEGALDIWKNYPIFGTGVETYAFAYYKFRPAAHNLTSEWNFLYNKAHNEYLNYLATTGTFGIVSYLLMIFYFIYVFFVKVLKKFSPKKIDINLSLSIALLISYFTILISNFFSFSVVMVSIYFYLIPAFVLALCELTNEEKSLVINLPLKGINKNGKNFRDEAFKNSGLQWVLITIISAVGLYMVYSLYLYWDADKAFAYGQNLNRLGQYQQAYPYLRKAIEERSDEPVFRDEAAINSATLATIMLNPENKKDPNSAAIAEKLIQEAIKYTNDVTMENPNNVVFRKTQTRVFYTLAQIDPRYYSLALEAIKRAQILAPTDANIFYNLAVLYGQNGQIEEAIKTLEITTKLKPNYPDAFYALGLFYHQASLKAGSQSAELNQKAIDSVQYILDKIAPKDKRATEAINAWKK